MPVTIPPPGQFISIPTIPNLRDLGGWRTPQGRVMRGILYRSAQFSALSGPDSDRFAELGIKTVFDMRTADEREHQPSALPEGTRGVVVDILEDATGAAPAELFSVLGDPVAAQEMLGGGRAVTLFTSAYKQIVNLASARIGYHRFYTALLDTKALPAVFHCTTGKDRTGWAAAALLLLLGVDYDDVLEDYLLTNAQLLPSLQGLLDDFESAGGDPALLLPVLGVQREYLDAALAEMTAMFGTVENYFMSGLGLTEADIALLRLTLIEFDGSADADAD
ncbi:protein-tyrosine phosphatase [Glaciihabitans tibetensis]|uniref:Protein-tyrosine phosphatase n=1 Tax=Glaciihabitans tibetensis TaxID=1266600 RepID=A0A2T0VIW3_9MICO|nr:tyrosine-protein phosphatase [Glaciihabitans tibetensis]PRY70157.1 protein-tyrosine phosphatase [Glaciihabitans tibetensis]